MPQRLSIELLQQEWTGVERVVHECHRDDKTVCRFLSIPISEHSVVFNCACDARAYVVLRIDESPMVL